MKNKSPENRGFYFYNSEMQLINLRRTGWTWLW